MRIEQSNRNGYVVLTLAGRLDLTAAAQLQRALLKHLDQRPPAIICDLAGLEAIDPVCAGAFTSLRHPALGWPGTTLALCGARPAVAAVLTQQPAPGPVPPLYVSLDDAITQVRARPAGLRKRLALEPGAAAASAARMFVRDLCAHWELDQVAEPAALLSERSGRQQDPPTGWQTSDAAPLSAAVRRHPAGAGASRAAVQLPDVGDRDQLAKWLLEWVIRPLFGIGLQLQAIAGLTHNSEAARRLTAVIANIDRLIEELRAGLFDPGGRQAPPAANPSSRQAALHSMPHTATLQGEHESSTSMPADPRSPMASSSGTAAGWRGPLASPKPPPVAATDPQAPNKWG